MAAKGTLQISILGTNFSIQADEDSLYLDKLMQYYRSTVADVSASTNLHDPLKIAVLSGIMIADELFKERIQSSTNATDTIMTSAELSEAERITLKMIKKIDKALE